MTIQGQYAQTVRPNAKCEGCLHYDNGRGQTGVCVIGLQPFTCGDGTNPPQTGYHPITSAQPGEFSITDNTPPAQAGKATFEDVETGDVVSLGEEYVAMVKSTVAELLQNERMHCMMHQSQTQVRGQASAHAGIFDVECSCGPITPQMVAKSFLKKLSNVERVQFSAMDVATLVHNVMKSSGAVGGVADTGAADSKLFEQKRKRVQRVHG